ncbi:uncharacterized protein N7473_004392 [Penicillium subrubescens]|uniref:uncharacterized protein n=1 Tax=Penicillium subrubescens TaxID=1316194 RepID=UPI002544DE2D|nr:uncharacterized protein N7473_004392 [Penicillium subrubescens]KAJ5900322.1 hypothetical protein N7473_004392 [Penicillium subrubescens]
MNTLQLFSSTVRKILLDIELHDLEPIRNLRGRGQLAKVLQDKPVPQQNAEIVVDSLPVAAGEPVDLVGDIGLVRGEVVRFVQLVGDKQDATRGEALDDLGYGLFEYFWEEIGIDTADDDEIVGDFRVRKQINILAVAEVEVDAGGQIGGDSVGEVVQLALANVNSVDARAV